MTCITARVWRMCRDACRDRLPAVTGKRSRHSRRMRTRNIAYLARGHAINRILVELISIRKKQSLGGNQQWFIGIYITSYHTPDFARFVSRFGQYIPTFLDMLLCFMQLHMPNLHSDKTPDGNQQWFNRGYIKKKLSHLVPPTKKAIVLSSCFPT